MSVHYDNLEPAGSAAGARTGASEPSGSTTRDPASCSEPKPLTSNLGNCSTAGTTRSTSAPQFARSAACAPSL